MAKDATPAVDDEEDIDALDTQDTAADAQIPADDVDDAADVQSSGGDDDADAGSAWSSHALEIAGRYGYDLDDFKDEKAFFRHVAKRDRDMDELSRSLEARFKPADAKPSTPDTKLTPQEKAALKRLEIKFNKGPNGEVDPEIVQAFTALNDHYHGTLEGLMKEVDELRSLKDDYGSFRKSWDEQRQQEATERFVKEWDEFFGGVPEDFHDKIGKGTLQELHSAHATAFLNNRDQIVALGESLRAQDEARGLRPLSRAQYGQRALAAVLGQDINAIARKQIISKAKTRTGAALAGANVKVQKKPTIGEGKAWRTYQEKAAKLGIPTHDDGDE